MFSIMMGKFQLQESNPAIVYLNRYVHDCDRCYDCEYATRMSSDFSSVSHSLPILPPADGLTAERDNEYSTIDQTNNNK